MTTTADGVLRRWVDVCWTGLPVLRKWDSRHIGKLYFGGLCAFMAFGLFMLWVVPDPKAVLLIATTMYNYAFGVSCLHTLAVNRLLLPKELRPNWINSTGLLLSGVFFLALSVFATVVGIMQHR
jgi:hypothetical protein